MAHFPGVYVAMITPFTDDCHVDYDRLAEHADWLIREGIEGLIPTGSLGEYASLTEEERKKVVETVIEAANGRVPIVVGTAAPATQQAVGWVKHAKDCGAVGAMALPPINYNPTPREVEAHYEALSSVGLPIIAYNNPRDYKTDLTPSFLKRLSAIPNIVAVKEFSGDVRRMQDILRETNLEVMVGVDDLAMEGALIGATGWIGGLNNTFPKECTEVFYLARAGKVEEAQQLYRYLLPLFHLDAKPDLVQSIKYTLELSGRPVGPTRPPRLRQDEEVRQEIKEAFHYFVQRPAKA